MSELAFIAGARPLDFVNTISWGDGGEERLVDYDAFLAWCRAAGLPLGRARDPRVLRKALQLRVTLHEIFSSHAEHRRIDDRKLDPFLSPAMRRLTVRKGVWSLRDPHHADAPLWWLAWEAAQLLTNADARHSLRSCANDRCRWLFLDQSRRHNRRWCDMQVCGSRIKSRAYYARLRAR
jgi:predicted RNA-binding Zn ribbon-like protein